MADKFEYKVVSIKKVLNDIENALTDLGNEGFDLVAVAPVPGGTAGGAMPISPMPARIADTLLIFKREI